MNIGGIRVSNPIKHLMDLNDVTNRVVKENLVPFLRKCRSIISEINVILLQKGFEGLNVVGAKGDMAPLDRVNMLSVFRRHTQILFSKMHLHRSLSDKPDFPCIAGTIRCIRPGEILWGQSFHLQDVPIEII